MNNETTNEIKPYPGLRCFQYKENYLFFGREGKAQEIASRLQESHFLAVVGTSGSGKSSLVRAGLLPLLYGGMLYEFGSHWRIALMRPEETPIHNLAEALTYPVDFETEENGNQPKDENQIAIAEATLRRSGVGLLDFLNNPANNFDEDENLLVVVDQFEELFRFKEKSALEDTEEAAAFVKLLLEATREKKGRIFVVITMRSDFLGDCAEFRDLPEAINDGQYLIPRMTRDQLRQSIESPAFVGDAQVSPALVNRLLNDLEDQNQALDVRDRIVKDHLPVLAHALMRTWDLWKERGELDKPIDVGHYDNEEIGGMAHALSIHADEAYNDLSESQKLTAKKMFRCLTETDSENRETRRPAKIEEICAVTGASEKVVCEIIEVFRQENKGRTFLMPPEGVDLTKETKIDISHESLIRNWEILKGWVREEAKDAWIYRRISEAALILRQYEDEMKDQLGSEEFERNCRDFLWRGIELKAALKWRETFEPNVDWASRYQPLTETEKLELRELSRTSPKSESAKRWEFIQLHFDKMTEFLDRSADHETVEQAKEEQIQQERMLAAEQLAEVEREKADGLRNLTDSLKRQRRFLFVVSIFSILMMVAASVTAIVAWQYYNSATRAQAEAVDEKENAKRAQLNAESEKENAKTAQKTAEEEKENAKASEKKADEEKDRAEKQTEIADKKKQEALEQKKKADAEKEKAKTQEEIALAAKGALQTTLTEKEEINKRSNLNLEGLAAYENYDFETALRKFQDLEKQYAASDTAGIWWAKYNIAKSYERLGKFEEALDGYDSALELLPTYPSEMETAGLKQFSGVSVINASYKPVRATAADALKESKIITLRKFAQFYRNCAFHPEDCFDIVSENFDYDIDSFSLNFAAAEKYQRLINLKLPGKDGNAPRLDTKGEIFLADVYRELGDTMLDLNQAEVAEKQYEFVISVYTEQKKSFAEISVRKKYLESKIRQLQPEKLEKAKEQASEIVKKKLDEAEAQVNEILKKKKEILKQGELTDKEIALNKSIGETYGELAEIYQKSSLKAAEFYLDRLREAAAERARENKSNKDKTNPATQPVENRQSQNVIDETGLSQEDKAFIKRLESAYTYENEPEFDDLTGWQKEVWGSVRIYYRLYHELDKKNGVLSHIALQIKSIVKDPMSEELVDVYGSLTLAYLTNNEVEKAKNVLVRLDEDSSKQSSGGDVQNNLSLRLKALELLTEFSRVRFNESCSSAIYADKWAEEFERAFPDQSHPARGKDFVDFYLTAATHHYLCSDCPEQFNKARQMFTAYWRYLEKNKESMTEPEEYSGWNKKEIFTRQINAQISIAQTYEREKNAGEAARIYDQLLRNIQTWKKDNPEIVRPANIAVNSNMPRDPRNFNAMNPANAVNTPNSNTGKTTTAKIDDRFIFYVAYLNVRLAELNFSKNESAAKDLPDNYTRNFSELELNIYSEGAVFLIVNYASSLKDTGDLLKEKNKEKAARYYQGSIELLELIKGAEDGFCRMSAEKYCAVYNVQTDGKGIMSGQYYSDYVEALKSLKDVTGDADGSLAPKITAAEQKKNALPILVTEKLKCNPAR